MGQPPRRPERGIPDGLIIGVLALLLGTTALFWTATELGALVSHGGFPHPLPFLSTAGAIRHLATAPNDLAGAWPGTPAHALPSAAAFWLTFFALFALVLFLLLSAATARAKRRAAHEARAAAPAGVDAATGPPGQRRGPWETSAHHSTAQDVPAGPASPTIPHPSVPGGGPDAAGMAWLPAGGATDAGTQWADDGSPALGRPAAQRLGMPSVADPDIWFPDTHAAPPVEPAEPAGPDAEGAGGAEGGAGALAASGVALPRPGGSTAAGWSARAEAAGTSDSPTELRFALPATGTMCVFAPEAGATARHALMSAVVAEAGGGPLVVVTADPELWETRPPHRRAVRFDPQQLTDEDPEAPRARWAPHTGCAEPTVATARARALLLPTVRPVADAEELAVRTLAETLLRCWLRAAALDGRPFRHVARWAGGGSAGIGRSGGGSASGRQEAVALLQSAATAVDVAAGEEAWAGQLQSALLQSAAPLDAAFRRVRAALAASAELHVLAACTPESPATALDPAALVQDGAAGSLYLLGRSGDGRLREPAGGSAPAVHSAMPLLSALVDDVVQRAWQTTAQTPRQAGDPTPLLVLDDIAAVAPFPTLPQLMADGGAHGLRAVALLRSPEQARARWGERSVHSLWTNADHRAILGPLAPTPLAALLASLGAAEHSVQAGLEPDELLVLAGRQHTAMPQRFRIGQARG
ncbi:hypothetical protein DN069_16265 [Streptacidiphilus pinicola]|uniref:TraD/TraG TraM recognition site domain-containing protein n=1 Tax=Streptacidiphilus pinicola TaxID=2219663 RepID=A0A2X0KB64_9ACTN|nr:TraM recognition domain-containing protein [Streptacidiphilus pinicola]RAG84599.1 hypothetical protein DN069_16265 [Streptacidiphilus pinicola]